MTYNLEAVPGTSNETWLGWQLRPQNWVGFALYLATGLAWSRQEADRRLLLLYVLPAVFLLELVVVSTFAGSVASSRYTIPMLPIVCLLAATGFVRLLRDRPDGGQTRFAVLSWLGGVGLGLGAIAAMGIGTRWLAADGRPPPTGRDALLAPALVLIAFIALTLFRAWPRFCAGLLAVAIFAGGAFPISRVASGLATRKVQREGSARFAGFYEVARAVEIRPDAVVYVSPNLYDGKIRAGAVPAITRLNFNVRLRTRQIVHDEPAPPANADYAVVSSEEYRRWLSRDGGDPERAVLSTDGAVALLCLREPCPRRGPP